MKFKAKKLTLKNGTIFTYLNVEFDDEQMIKTLKQSYLKSKYTNAENQNGDKRVRSKKFDKQIEGILGEIAIEQCLIAILKKCENKVEIIRYDDIRTDKFKTPQGEFDLKIITANKEFTIEARASINYKYHFSETTLDNLDTLGTYVNPKKKNEKKSDFYIRPLFQIRNPDKNLKIESISILDYILDDKIELYLTGGCDSEMMFGALGKQKTMGQSKTKYQTLSIKEGWDMKELVGQFRKLFC